MALTAVAIGLLIALALQTRLGLLTTRGSSMQPHFREGDLAITARASAYEVGDIVAYRSRHGDHVVLHRIVEAKDGRYTFKGDNNDFTDPDTVTERDILGKLWIRFEGAGFVADFTSKPFNALLLVGGLTLLLGRATTSGPRRRPNGRPGARHPGTRRRPSGAAGGGPRWIGAEHGGLEPSLSAPAATVAGAVLLMGLSFSTPSTRPANAQRDVRQTVTYDYGATATPGVTYPDGEVTTGSAIFLQLVDDIRFELDYALAATNTANISGTYSVDLVVSGIGSWRRTLPLVAPTTFDGRTFRTEVEMVPSELLSLANTVAEEIGMASRSLNLAIVPRVDASGTLGEAPFAVTFDEPLQLTLDDVELTVATKMKGDELATTSSSEVTIPVERARTIGFAGREIRVGTARTLTTLGFLAAAAWLAWSISESQRQAQRTAAQRLVHRYAASIVDVDRIMVDGVVVDVDDMASLARIAESAARLILHETVDGVDTFAVDDGATTFRYRVDSPPPAPAPAAAESWEAGTPPPYLPEAPAVTEPAVTEPTVTEPPTPETAAPPATLADALQLTELTAEEAAEMGLGPVPEADAPTPAEDPGVTYF